ncbi:MAG: OmpH family outer membrane protein [Pyrinomonadaceae bacterium]
MKSYRTAAAAIIFAGLIGITSIYAQQPGGAKPAASAPTTTPAAVGNQTIAIIDTGAFADPKEGITRLSSALGGLEREFKPRTEKLQSMRTQYQKLAQEIQTLNGNPAVDPKTAQAKSEQLQTLERDTKRETEDAQAAFNKRQQEVTEPVMLDISKNLEAYARQRGISIVIDPSRLGGAIFVINDSMNITKDFITQYNAKNPSTTAVAAPK